MLNRSRFERDESEISCIRLINILDKLHVLLGEFLILHDGEHTQTENFVDLVQYIRKEYPTQKTDNIFEILINTHQPLHLSLHVCLLEFF